MSLVYLILLFFLSCQSNQPEKPIIPVAPGREIQNKPRHLTYAELVEDISARRKSFKGKNFDKQALTDFWVRSLSSDLYEKWKDTPWDFNGTATEPGKGKIACGFFVTTVLRDMDLTINRTKLAVCASSVMMKAVVPAQKLQNLSHLSYDRFNDSIKQLGKGVYITGLDYHTGFIVNDGSENWFIHSNYIERKGVVKELVKDSRALKSSKTRWVVSMTGDVSFLKRWVAG